MKSVAAVALAASLLSVAHGVSLRNQIQNQLFEDSDPSTDDDMEEEWCPEACNGCYGNGANLTSCDEGVEMMQCIVENVPELAQLAAQVPPNITDALFETYFSSWNLCDAPEGFDGCTVPDGSDGEGTAGMQCDQIKSYLECGATNSGLNFDEAESVAIETLVVAITECQPSDENITGANYLQLQETNDTNQTDDDQWCPESCNGCYGMGHDLKSCEEGLDMMECIQTNAPWGKTLDAMIPSDVSQAIYQSYFSAWGLCDVPEALANCTAPTGVEGEGTDGVQCGQIKSYLQCGAENAGLDLSDDQKSVLDTLITSLSQCEKE